MHSPANALLELPRNTLVRAFKHSKLKLKCTRRSANALLELPRAEGVLPPGTPVSALLIDDLSTMPCGPAEGVPPTQGF